jgi:hypothetical protein
MTVLYSFLKRVIKNDAIHLDPPQVYNWRVFALAASVRIIRRHPVMEGD